MKVVKLSFIVSFCAFPFKTTWITYFICGIHEFIKLGKQLMAALLSVYACLETMPGCTLGLNCVSGLSI